MIISMDAGFHRLGGFGIHLVDSSLKPTGWIDLVLRVDLDLLIAAVCEQGADISVAMKGGSLKC